MKYHVYVDPGTCEFVDIYPVDDVPCRYFHNMEGLADPAIEYTIEGKPRQAIERAEMLQRQNAANGWHSYDDTHYHGEQLYSPDAKLYAVEVLFWPGGR